MNKYIFIISVMAACGRLDNPASISVSRAALGVDAAQFNFETSTQGWAKSGTKITSVNASTAQAFNGVQSLAVNFTTSGTVYGQQVVVGTSQQLAGSTITYNVYLPLGMPLTSMQVFAQENAQSGWRWNSVWKPASALTFGAWNTISLTIPSNAAPLQSIGVEFALSGTWAGAAYVDSVSWGAQDAGQPVPDAGVDAGRVDAGSVDAGMDAGSDAGNVQVDAGVDAGQPFVNDGGITAIRFGASKGSDGLFSNSPVNPNLRTVTAWVRFRATTTGLSRQMNLWSLENNAPSNAYQLLISTWRTDQWESHDSTQGGFLFAKVDLGWWFIAETNRSSGPATKLYFKRDGDFTLKSTSGNTHPVLNGVTRFLIGTDDATGQNEWMDGDITDVKVWNAELTQAEIDAESTKLNPVRTANLHAFYPLQNVQTMFQDMSGNGRNLVPITTGGTWSVQGGPSSIQ